MRYQISGKQIDIGDALQTHVKDQLGDVISKYAERPTDAHVIFSKNAHEFVCEAIVHLSTGLTAQARGSAVEIYAAFESCSDKMEKQLRRYKRRLIRTTTANVHNRLNWRAVPRISSPAPN